MNEIVRGFETPRAVTDYFAQKRLKPAFSWLDVWAEEHAHAFTVAKATETELLGTFHRTLAEAIEKGESFETWKSRLEPELKRLGWWGPRMVADPAGLDDAREVDFSAPRRLQTIFHSNMRSARAAGQWQRIQRTKRALPFVLYVRTSSAEPRPEHLAFEGIILPADDPFWRTHFPPNGWGCKCSVRQISEREARALGYDPEAGGPQIVWREFVNRRTGETVRVPEGIDPGWHTNPGLARARTLTDRFAADLRAVGPDIAGRQVTAFWASPERRILTQLPEQGLSLPAGVSPKLRSALGADGDLVAIFAETARAKLARGQTRRDALDRLPEILASGTVIDEGADARHSVYWSDGERWWVAVVLKAATGFMRVVTFHQVGARQAARAFERFGE